MDAPKEPPVGPGHELRVLTPDDWQTWRVLRLEALARAPYAFGSTHADWARATEVRWRARLGLPCSHNLVAFTGSTPVGMASGMPHGETVELISMYVAEQARGTGVADALIDAIASWARSRGAARLRLDVVADNHHARRLYERHGLVVVGEAERESPTDPPELRMCKPLVAGP